MKRFKTLLVSVAVLVTMAVGVSPAAAVTDGWVDSNNAYPMVGLMVALNDAGEPMWRCSGTLLSPTVYLTAGHCTFGAASVEIWFDVDVESGIPDNGYPYDGDVSGTPYTHPDFNPDAFYLADVGIVVLDEPVYLDAYGYLPEVNELDVWETRRGRQDSWLTAVGYGLQKSYPDAASWKNEALRIRMIAQPRLIQINQGIVGDLSLLLSNNANTGGTCFGDSGGPNFVRDSFKIAGVTSFGLNGNCAGTGGVFRVDRAGAQEFINQFL
jgi:hypothetical protein